MKTRSILVAICLIWQPLASLAQEIEIFFAEFSHLVYQNGPATFLRGSELGEDWSDFKFIAGISTDSETGTISNPMLSGPGYSGELPLDDGEFAIELGFESEAALAGITSGTYTFTGTGSTVGTFSVQLEIPPYSKLEPRLVTNYTALQAFDPQEPLVIEWQEFVEGQGENGGIVDIEIYYKDDLLGDLWLWGSDEVAEEDAFGLPPTQTSISIPAGIVSGSPDRTYTVNMLFLRIESLNEVPAVPGAMAGFVTGTETKLYIREKGALSEWANYQVDENGWTDTSRWIGWLNTLRAPWIWSTHFSGWIYIPETSVTASGGWVYLPKK